MIARKTYTIENVENQAVLQSLANDIITYGNKVRNEETQPPVLFLPDGTPRDLEDGRYCIEIEFPMGDRRYWIHFKGCRVTEIIEDRF